MKDKDEQKINELIRRVVDQFKFPDGCLDLGYDDQEDFIAALTMEILTTLMEEEKNQI
jgi:hypothetical protein